MSADHKPGDVVWAFFPPDPPYAVTVISVCSWGVEVGRNHVRTPVGCPREALHATEREAQQAYFGHLKEQVSELNDSIASVLDRLAVLEAEPEEPPR